jgi:hypothetical protein
MRELVGGVHHPSGLLLSMELGLSIRHGEWWLNKLGGIRGVLLGSILGSIGEIHGSYGSLVVLGLLLGRMDDLPLNWHVLYLLLHSLNGNIL